LYSAALTGGDKLIEPAKDSLDLGVVVSDIEASLAFYRDVLGLSYVGSNPLWFGTLHRLRFGKSDFKLIDPSKTPQPAPKGLESTLGFRYVTFVINNLDEICSLLAELKITFVKEAIEIRPGVRIAMVLDPDGNIVEFVELSKQFVQK